VLKLEETYSGSACLGKDHITLRPLMTSRNVTRSDLAKAVAQTVGLSKNDAVALAEQVLAEISDTLARGENVKLSGFGVFTVRNKAERVGRNPKTGVEVPIEPRRVISFNPSATLKEHVNRAPAED
jgi:integration host factor subunit alpha